MGISLSCAALVRAVEERAQDRDARPADAQAHEDHALLDDAAPERRVHREHGRGGRHGRAVVQRRGELRALRLLFEGRGLPGAAERREGLV